MSSEQFKPNLAIKLEPISNADNAEFLEKLNIKSEPSSQETQPTFPEQQPSTSSQITPTSAAAITAAKRTFVPNLAVQRNIKETKQEAEEKPRRTPAPNLNTQRGRGGRGARNQNVIQSHSIFEAGPAESTKRYGGRESYEGYSVVGGSGRGVSDHHHHSSSVKRDGSDSVSHETRIKVEESSIIEDVKNNEKTAYIKLKPEAKETDDFKQSDAYERLADLKDTSILMSIFNQEKEDQNTKKLVVFQIPENLNLNTLPEGHIGKVRIRKSGRVEFCMNKVSMDVSLSVTGPFLQDAVALEIPSADRKPSENGDMINLGHIQNKVVCSPNFF